MDAVCSVLSRGEACIIPCDTIYGFVGRVPESEQIIRQIKGREETKPFLQIILKEWLPNLTDMRLDDYLLDYWPGPLTMILENLNGATTAYRAPDDPFLSELLLRSGVPLYSTSVNRAGRDPLNSIDQIIDEFGEEVPLIIDGGDLGVPTASTILDVTVDPPKVIRQGACQVILRDSR